jgi:hypothetical protein
MPPGKTIAPVVQELVSGDTILPLSALDTCCIDLNEEDLAFAKEFLGEDDDSRQTQIDSLRNYVQANPYLNARIGNGANLFLKADHFYGFRFLAL